MVEGEEEEESDWTEIVHKSPLLASVGNLRRNITCPLGGRTYGRAGWRLAPTSVPLKRIELMVWEEVVSLLNIWMT